MIKDKEGHEVHIAEAGNGHTVVLGNSGQGKTFFLCRMIEEACERGEKVLIIDFSGSYSEKQLLEKGFLYIEKTRRYNIRKDRFSWRYRVSEQDMFHDDIADAICQVLNCKSYVQIKVLHDVLEDILKIEGKVSLSNIVNKLEEILQDGQESEKVQGYMDGACKLLSRLYPYRIGNLYIQKGKTLDDQIMPVTIVDLTDFPERQRKFLAEFIMSLFWREIYRQEFANRCDVILLDEIQFLSMKDGSTLPSLLREAQKREVKILLSTQFISAYDKSELRTLEQAENLVIFRPTPEDYRWSAKKMSIENHKEWEKKLAQLQRGQAIFKGNYRLDNRKKIISSPIIIQLSGNAVQ